MFEFKILQAPDRTQLGTYEHAADELVIGSSEGEMVIDDPQIGAAQLKLYFQGSQILGHNLNPKVEVKLNNVPMGPQPLPIKARDTIAMGKTLLTLLKVKAGPLEPPQLDESSRAKKPEQLPEGSNERAILKALEALSKAPHQQPTPDTATLTQATVPPPLPKPPLPTKT